jgi:succinylarginine dihydrolase
VIVMRKRGQVRLVFPGTDKTTLAMTAAQATHLIIAISVASGMPR